MMPRFLSLVTGLAALRSLEGPTQTFSTPSTGATNAMSLPSQLSLPWALSALPKSTSRGMSADASAFLSALSIAPVSGELAQPAIPSDRIDAITSDQFFISIVLRLFQANIREVRESCNASATLLAFRVLPQKFERRGPGLFGCLRVRAVLAGLLSQEAMARAVIDVGDICLAGAFHRVFGRLDGRCHPRVVAAVETDYRRGDVLHIRRVGLRTVVDDRRIELRLMRGIREALRAAPAEPDRRALPVRRGQLRRILAHGVEIAHHALPIKPAHRFG